MNVATRRFYPWLALLILSACASLPPACPSPPGRDVVYVVRQGWHTQIGIPVDELGPDLAFYRPIFAGARVIMFGYGKKTFLTAPPDAGRISEYILGPVPGPAVIQAVGLRVLPPRAYPSADTLTLTLPPGGARALSDYIWHDLVKDENGRPLIVARSRRTDGLLYAAHSEYTLLHTCNAWTADSLQSAVLPVSGGGVIFSDQIIARLADAAQAQCRP